jgi:hypothetical protein
VTREELPVDSSLVVDGNERAHTLRCFAALSMTHRLGITGEADDYFV